MGVPTSHTEPSSPTNLLAIQREVLGYPLYWVGHTSELLLTELPIKSSCETAESGTSLRPRVGPSKRFVVVDSFFLKARRPYDTYDLILGDTWWKSTHTNNNGILLLLPFSVTLMPRSPMCRPISATISRFVNALYCV